MNLFVSIALLDVTVPTIKTAKNHFNIDKLREICSCRNWSRIFYIKFVENEHLSKRAHMKKNH